MRDAVHTTAYERGRARGPCRNLCAGASRIEGMRRTAAVLVSLAGGVALALVTPAGSGDRPVSSAPPQSAAGEPDGVLALAVLSPERAMLADPRTGATTERELSGGTLCHGPLLVAGGRVLLFDVDGPRLVARSVPLGRPGRAFSLGRADTAIASSAPDRLWLGRYTRLSDDTTRIELREIEAGGRVVARASGLLPRWGALHAVLDGGGLLVTRGRDLVLQRPGGPRLLFRRGWPVAASGARVAWCREPCRRIRLWSDGRRQLFAPPPGVRPELGPAGALSPDGSRLALPVTVDGRSRAAVLDLERGAWSIVPRARLGDYAALAWSPSGRWLYLADQRDRVLASRGGTERAIALPIHPGATVMSIAASTPGSAGR
jgi:hypothetical protein